MPIEAGISSADLAWFRQWRDHKLRGNDAVSEARAQLPMKKAYCDAFVHQPKVYSRFLRRMSSAGMLRWQRADPHEDGELGIFFVAGNSGQLIFIFDTRVVNCRFHSAPMMPLSFAAAFAALEVDSGSTPYGSGGDVRNYFYMVGVPDDMSSLFSLPACPAGLLGLTGVDLGDGRGPLTFNDRVLACLRALPVGFNWALHLAQVISLECARQAGVEDSQFITDRFPGQRIRSCEAPRVAIYADNYFAFGADAEAVSALADRLGKQFRRQGLPTHEESVALLRAPLRRVSAHGAFAPGADLAHPPGH